MLNMLSPNPRFDNNKISKPTKKIVKTIEKVNELMGSAVYYSGIRPEQWDNFVKLKKIATTQELIELTNHKNGVVRCYSFWALSHKKEIDFSLFNRAEIIKRVIKIAAKSEVKIPITKVVANPLIGPVPKV